MLYWLTISHCLHHQYHHLIGICHLVNAGLKAVTRFSFAVLKKLILSDEQAFIVTESLVRIEGNIEGGKSQRVLADHEVLVVMDEDGVL